MARLFNGIRAVIFDLDGVIVDSEPIHRDAEEAALAHYGIAVPDRFYDEFRGRTDEDIAAAVVSRYPHANVVAEEFIRLKDDEYRRRRDRVTLVDGSLDFIRFARQRFEKLGVTTSATRADQQFAFDRFHLAEYFDAVVTAEDIARPKPDPDPYLQTAKRLGIEPTACLVIEDSRNGAISAKRAGCLVVAITTSFGESVLSEAGADFVVKVFPALFPLLVVQRGG